MTYDPNQEQIQVLTTLFAEEQTQFREQPDTAEKYVSIGQTPPLASIDPIELASMTLVVNTILNFDDFYMKR